MPGPTVYAPTRSVRLGAALTLVFVGVLATGAAAGSWSAQGQDGRKPSYGAPAPGDAKPAQAPSGDRWSAVYTAEEYEGFERALDGAYVGVGLSARRTGGGLMEVAGVQPGSPAARAGLLPGDRLRTVDGLDVTGRPVTEVVARLRGDWDGDGDGDAPASPPSRAPHTAGHGPAVAVPGTPVRLGLERGSRSWERTLRRERLATRSVVVDRLRDGGSPPATLVKVGAFTKGTGARVREVVRAVAPREGVLLDLRGNSGGLLTEAVGAASAFLDGGLVATYDVHGRPHALRAGRGGDTRRPLVVLVDAGTMSAAELLAGALQDRGRAVLVGTRTFGKGSVQMPSRLADGSVAELTVGHYRTPAGRAVDGVGITPDLVVRGDAEPRGREVLGGLGAGS
ncbi:S41 family peptidase [Streptomyces sp. NPDC049577]|uniref:S41 family peptidase n=1 Tax=Streptomyces sp. NPDC049577 TaxID=3155153 RepID=UPI0034301E62